MASIHKYLILMLKSTQNTKKNLWTFQPISYWGSGAGQSEETILYEIWEVEGKA